MISDRTRTIVIYVVLFVWSANFFAPFFVHTYNPDAAINGIFMAIVGGALIISKKDGKKEDDDARK